MICCVASTFASSRLVRTASRLAPSSRNRPHICGWFARRQRSITARAWAIASARMQPAEAVARILDRVTERAQIRRLGAEGPLLDTVGRLCRAVPVHHLQRTADLSALPALADRVLALAGGADAP